MTSRVAPRPVCCAERTGDHAVIVVSGELSGAAALGRLGPFVAIDTHGADEMPGPGWSPLSVLLDRPEVLSARIEAVRESLAQRRPGTPGGPAPHRVAASVAHLGLVARLLAPHIAGRALGLRVRLDPEQVWWRDELGGPLPLSCVLDPAPAEREPAVGEAVAALTEAVAGRHGVGVRVAWGNVGSAANGAASQIAAARPQLAEAARAAADRVLADPRVDGGALRTGPGFRRRSCCLIYRVFGRPEGLCGDCVLAG